MTLRFGTDGIRGVANRELTPELVLTFGRAVARVIGRDAPFLIGRDTRQSGTVLEAALTAGLCSEGADVQSAGILPTPGLAFLSQVLDAPAAMISASHNPFPDNGIKLFARGGRKIPDALETALEAELATLVNAPDAEPRLEGAQLGVASRIAGSVNRYVMHLVDSIEGRRLDGMRVVVDCGNGAAYGAAPWALRELGVDVTALSTHPDGTNINFDCGSTDPSTLQQRVLDAGADAGLAFDGDADRVIAVDEHGDLVDGDHLLAISAVDLRDRDRLKNNTVAITVMANLGLRHALDAEGIGVVETPVGDRHVLVAMEEHGLSLGGEQSGHVIFSDLATTGDGTLTGVLLLDTMQRARRPLSELAAVVQKVPQVLTNVRIASRDVVENNERLATTVRAVSDRLGASGRVLVRPSGTEPVVRVMVEAPTEGEAEAAAREIVEALGPSSP